MSTDELPTAPLTLPLDERAELACELLRSLDEPADADAEAAWLDTIERRAGELAVGSVQPVEWVVVRERIAHQLHGIRADTT